MLVVTYGEAMADRESGRTGTVSVGVLGCARIAWRRTLPALCAQPRFRLTAIASRDAGKARTFTDRFGGTPVVGYQRLLERDDVDAVYVPLPPALHEAWACRALLAGKHVLVEKPFAVTAAGATRMCSLAVARRLVIAENMMFVYHDQHAAARQLVEEGRIGVPRGIEATFGFPPLPRTDFRYVRDLGGGALLDAGVYPLRATRLLLADSWTPEGAVSRVDRRSGVDVGGHALLRSPEGPVAHVSFGFEFSYRCAYAVWGSEGRLVLDRAFTSPPTRQPVIRLERQDDVEEIRLPAQDHFASSLLAFAAAVLDREPLRHGLADIVAQAELVDRVRAAATEVET